MSGMKSKIEKLLHPSKLVTPLGSMRLLDWMPDAWFVRLAYHGETGKKLNLKHPTTFNEKLQLLKVFDHKDEYSAYVDKIQAKEIIGSRIGKEYIVPMLGIWNSPEEIDFSSLPCQFVLKCNHDQGSVVIIKDKDSADLPSAVAFLKRKLQHNIYYGTREYPYKNIMPKVFAEAFLMDEIIDYKFYCFQGEPKFLYCGKGLTEDHSLKIDFYDTQWHRMPFYRTDYQRLGDIEKPNNLDEMLQLAKTLSQGLPFVRIDLFNVAGKVYFSEYTLCPASGFMPFVPEEYDRIVGEWLTLPTE